jgi:hypothetical protein
MDDRRSKRETLPIGEAERQIRWGRLLAEIISDDPTQRPSFKRVELLGDGREFRLRSVTSTTLVVDGNVTELIAVGDSIDVENAGSANGSFVVQSGSAYNGGTDRTTINVDGPVGSATINDTYPFRSRASITPVRWESYWSAAITAIGSGANGTVDVLDSTLGDDVHLCDCDMFLRDQQVQISGSAGGVNDKIFNTRLDYSVSGATRTIYLDGYVNAIASGSLGTITLLGPPPQRVVGYGQAILRAQRLTIPAGALVPLFRDSTRNNFWSIITPDAGPSDAGDPE